MHDLVIALRAGFLAPLAFLLPGWLVARRAGAPVPLLGAFLVSCVLWFYLVLGCDAVGLTLDRRLLGGWVVVCLIVAAWSRGRSPAARSEARLPPRPRGATWWWVPAAAIGLLSIAARAIIDPLSGWDNVFRWDYLARALLAQGHFHFYPPVTAHDFGIYAWCDGIPPLVPLLNVWLYLVGGSLQPVVTSVRVIAEALLVGVAVFRLAGEIWGEDGGWPAVGLLATSALASWSIAMGQESGMLALALLALVLFLEHHRRQPRTGTAVWAGIAAGVGALSRDYALALIVLGAAVVASRRPRRNLAAYLAAALLVALPWYGRNWLHTGNPIYPLTLGGLLPGNLAYSALLQSIGAYWGFGAHHQHFWRLGADLLVLTGAVATAAAVGGWKAGRRAWPVWAACGLMGALWLWSVPYTAGGTNYSLRVLAPAVAVIAALGGWLGSRALHRRARTAFAIFGLLLALDAGRRAWFLPYQPLASPLSCSMEPWRQVRDALRQFQNQNAWQPLIDTADGGIIAAVDNVSLHTAISQRGGRAALLFSPQFAPCFDPTLSFTDVLARLRGSGVRLFLLNTDDPVVHGVIQRCPFLRVLVARFQRSSRIDDLDVYDLAALRPRHP